MSLRCDERHAISGDMASSRIRIPFKNFQNENRTAHVYFNNVCVSYGNPVKPLSHCLRS